MVCVCVGISPDISDHLCQMLLSTDGMRLKLVSLISLHLMDQVRIYLEFTGVILDIFKYKLRLNYT